MQTFVNIIWIYTFYVRKASLQKTLLVLTIVEQNYLLHQKLYNMAYLTNYMAIIYQESSIFVVSTKHILRLYVVIMSRKCFRESESTLHSCLNFKELLTRNRRDIWSLSDSNGIWTHNHLVHKQTLNHLAKLASWLSVHLRTKWMWVWIPLLPYILRSERQINVKPALLSSIENNLFDHETKDAVEPRVYRRKSNDNTPNSCIMCQK